ncbi:MULTISPECIES: phosphatidylglycerol lysyltransferase domain-containing protein [unclassified Mycolicibacterium]|nr:MULTISPECIES: phosphatidylglycerol lysyltransferase domain-containing protein [unclassified Mycolicibacterium]
MRIWSLINETHGDPLAPFAMAEGRRYFFSLDATAALSYQVLSGYAVVAGDPIGNPDRYGEVVGGFAALCRERGWRIAVLGASDQRLALWHKNDNISQQLTAVPIGRDVVIDVNRFSLNGRRKRNLRQAVQRTHNAGVTTQVVAERNLDDDLRAELHEVMIDSGKAVEVERGFSMMLGNTLSGRYPGVLLIIARDHLGQVQGFHRYASAGRGTDLSLDLPWRRKNAPNGIDERLTIDMTLWAKDHGGQRVSLAFAPFPELFDSAPRNGPGRQALRLMAHLADRFIKLESLYRYVRKFDAMDHQRFALFPRLHAGHALTVLLTLEFSRHHTSGVSLPVRISATEVPDDLRWTPGTHEEKR